MGADQEPGKLHPLPGIQYQGDLSVFNGALEELRFMHGIDPRVEFTHLVDNHDTPMVEVVTPFVFDRRQFPGRYRGLYLLHHFSDVPDALREEDPRDQFSPQSIERFVDSQADQIREHLGNPGMSRGEILDALSAGLGGPRPITGGFDGYKRAYEALRR